MMIAKEVNAATNEQIRALCRDFDRILYGDRIKQDKKYNYIKKCLNSDYKPLIQDIKTAIYEKDFSMSDDKFLQLFLETVKKTGLEGLITDTLQLYGIDNQAKLLQIDPERKKFYWDPLMESPCYVECLDKSHLDFLKKNFNFK